MSDFRPIPLIAVADVVNSTAFYADLLGLDPLGRTYENTHNNRYNRLYRGTELVLQLHSWDDDDHPNLDHRPGHTPGHGVLLWFQMADYEDARHRARTVNAEILIDHQWNPGPRAYETWLKDPDGYVVVLAGPDNSTR